MRTSLHIMNWIFPHKFSIAQCSINVLFWGAHTLPRPFSRHYLLLSTIYVIVLLVFRFLWLVHTQLVQPLKRFISSTAFQFKRGCFDVHTRQCDQTGIIFCHFFVICHFGKFNKIRQWHNLLEYFLQQKLRI
jgi:hypothetical protein